MDHVAKIAALGIEHCADGSKEQIQTIECRIACETSNAGVSFGVYEIVVDVCS